MDIVNDFKAKVKGRGLRVVLPEGHDERIVAAAWQLKNQGIAEAVVLGKPEQVAAAAEKAGVNLGEISVVNPSTSDQLEDYAKKYIGGRDDLTEAVARRMIKRPMFYGGMMVALGQAEAIVGGAACATATVIQAGALTVGFAEGISTPSSFFVMRARSSGRC